MSFWRFREEALPFCQYAECTPKMDSLYTFPEIKSGLGSVLPLCDFGVPPNSLLFRPSFHLEAAECRPPLPYDSSHTGVHIYPILPWHFPPLYAIDRDLSFFRRFETALIKASLRSAYFLLSGITQLYQMELRSQATALPLSYPGIFDFQSPNRNNLSYLYRGVTSVFSASIKAWISPSRTLSTWLVSKPLLWSLTIL